MTREEKIEYLAKAVVTLSELGDGKTAYVLNEIRLEMKGQTPLPEGLEEAAEEYTRSEYSSPCAFGGENIEEWVSRIFIAGAEHQRKQDQKLIELAEDHAMLAGMCKMKEEMMEKAVEFECIGKKVKMTIQELINYYIDQECCDVADECGF